VSFGIFAMEFIGLVHFADAMVLSADRLKQEQVEGCPRCPDNLRPVLANLKRPLCFGGRGEAIATADRGDLEVQAGVLRVAALIDHGEIGLLRGDDADEGVVAVMALAEVGTETALT